MAVATPVLGLAAAAAGAASSGAHRPTDAVRIDSTGGPAHPDDDALDITLRGA